jgi:FKBP-type peptidyl-prolyl cis-trans isomerase 2
MISKTDEVLQMTVKKGDKVKVDYVGSYEDGDVFDDSKRHGQPLEFQAGTGAVIPGFDNAVIGMKKGEKKIVTIEPKDGYGEHHPELIMKMPREMVPKDKEPQPGMMMVVGTPDGKKFPAIIREIGPTELLIDLNHPLAGKKLKFEITLVE